MFEPKRELLLNKLRKMPGLTAKDLEAELPTVNVRTVLWIARQEGTVRVDDAPKRPRYYAADDNRAANLEGAPAGSEA